MGRCFLPAALALALAAGCGRAWYEPQERGGGDAGGDSPDGGASESDAGVFTTGGALADTFLSESEPGESFGDRAVLRTARSPRATILLRFALEVPAGATARAVTLSVSTSGAGQDPSDVRVYRVFEDWSEEEASWELRAAGQAWATAGCGVGSRDAAARAELAVEAAATRYQVALPTSVAQGWIDDPDSNHGLALIATSGSGVELVSSESGEPAERPSLAVEWTR
ncbi:MAG TPA: DNRLRE domain-containing protein [Kofleriaceae bacterium]|nr:DNRLRE domain-containing protein [Kofleriaceae bacterium]